MINHFLTQTFEHWKYGTETDGADNKRSAWTKSDDIVCQVRPLSGDRIIRDEARNVIADVKFYMDFGEDVQVGDQLRSGDHYEVTAVIDPMSMGRFLQVEARLI